MKRLVVVFLCVLTFVAVNTSDTLSQPIVPLFQGTTDEKEITVNQKQLRCHRPAEEYLKTAEYVFESFQNVGGPVGTTSYLTATFTRGILATQLFTICSELERTQKFKNPSTDK